MRPFFWGLILFVLSVVGWVISVILTVLTAGKFKAIANIFGIAFAFSLPLALVFELIRWFKRRRKK